MTETLTAERFLDKARNTPTFSLVFNGVSGLQLVVTENRETKIYLGPDKKTTPFSDYFDFLRHLQVLIGSYNRSWTASPL